MNSFSPQEPIEPTADAVGSQLECFFTPQTDYRSPYTENSLNRRAELSFNADYHSARTDFLNRAREAGAQIDSFQLAARSRTGQPLFIDFAIFVDGTPERALLHISGTHGPEGYSGSAIQSDILSAPVHCPSGSMIVFCHGLNPFGMAEYQRTNEDNVDPNRNYRCSPKEFNEGICSDYQSIDSLVHPVNEAELFATLQLLANNSPLRNAFLEQLTRFLPGQNDKPEGLFYTGTNLVQSYTLLNHFFNSNLPDSIRDLFIIDVHTGLGSFGGEMLFSQPTALLSNGQDLYKQLTQTAGVHITAPNPDAENFYDSKGDTVVGARSYLTNNKDIACNGICQEFGTYPFETIAATLIAENFYRAQGKPRPHHALKAIKEMFNPDSHEWQKSILYQGNRLYEAVVQNFLIR